MVEMSVKGRHFVSARCRNECQQCVSKEGRVLGVYLLSYVVILQCVEGKYSKPAPFETVTFYSTETNLRCNRICVRSSSRQKGSDFTHHLRALRGI